jgi:hypothetical protein
MVSLGARVLTFPLPGITVVKLMQVSILPVIGQTLTGMPMLKKIEALFLLVNIPELLQKWPAVVAASLRQHLHLSKEPGNPKCQTRMGADHVEVLMGMADGTDGITVLDKECQQTDAPKSLILACAR